MARRRVVVTGMGVVACNGVGVENFWSALKQGKSGIGLISRFTPGGFPCQVAGEIRNFNPLHYLNAREAKRTALYSQYAIAAGRMAVADARLDDLERYSSRLRVILGVASPAIDVMENAMGAFMKSGDPSKMKPIPLEALFAHAPTNEIAKALGARGSSLTVSTGCTSGANAIGAAVEEIRSGRCDIAVTGGTENMLSYYTFLAFTISGMLPQDPRENERPERVSRPFDRTRCGGVLSEGCGILILEEREFARNRGALPYAEISGFDNSQTPSYKNPEELISGFVRSATSALADADMTPEDIDYISAHGCSDPMLDKVETRAMKMVFGRRAPQIPMSSIKSCIGNPSAANGPLQAVSAVMAIKEDVIPPTINLENPDPECDLDYVPLKARRNRVNAALINAHSFTGTDASLILRRIENRRGGL